MLSNIVVVGGGGGGGGGSGSDSGPQLIETNDNIYNIHNIHNGPRGYWTSGLTSKINCKFSAVNSCLQNLRR